MNRTLIFIALTLSGTFAASCVQTSFFLQPGYCSGAENGDAFCGEQYPDGSKPYCRTGTDACNADPEPGFDGCVAERPEDECYSPCGQGNTLADDASCLDDETTVADGSESTGSSGETENPSTTVDPDTGSSTEEPTTTGPSGCMSDEECMEADAPFCDPEGNCVACDGMPEPDVACEGADALTPVCEAGACVQCTAENPAACEGTMPICGVGNTCEGCTEHAQCPESACHLDGADTGACFDAADVQMVANTTALETALGGVSANDDVVLVLTGSDYSGLSVDLVASAEVAILGDGSQTLSGNRPGGLVATGGSSIVYFAGVSVQSNGSGDGLSCSGSAVWLDDAEVRNNAQVGLDVSGGCEAHLRRTVVRANSGGGITADGGVTSLSLENSVVADNVGATAGPGVRVLGAELSMTYSVVVSNGTFANPDNLECLSGAGGSVRNSIISGPSGNSIVTCNALTFSSSAVDATGLGGSTVNVGAYDSTWFSPADGLYTLTASGETEFMDIAQWVEGDPLFDFEGDVIPTDVPSFPGYDQP